jgi:hypothetical protein
VTIFPVVPPSSGSEFAIITEHVHRAIQEMNCQIAPVSRLMAEAGRELNRRFSPLHSMLQEVGKAMSERSALMSDVLKAVKPTAIAPLDLIGLPEPQRVIFTMPELNLKLRPLPTRLQESQPESIDPFDGEIAPERRVLGFAAPRELRDQ